MKRARELGAMSAAIRIDAATGSEERLEHVQGPNGPLYSWAVRPPGSTACVLVCSSILGDFTSNYHRERQLGHALAARGYGAVRFHYAGEGNSLGDRRNMTFMTMCDDAKTVLAHARSLGFERLGLVGTRLGALVAATTAAAMDSPPLALWDPVSDPLGFIKEARRAKKMTELAQDSVGVTRDWREELAQNGVLDLLGYAVYSRLIESLQGLSVSACIGARQNPLFMASFRTRDATMDRLADELAARGVPVEFSHFGAPDSSWLPSENVFEHLELIDATSGWFIRAFGGPQ